VVKLSIVIVNYNVAQFLEQCLASVAKAIVKLNAEVFVVDNASVDESIEMVKVKFPWVHLIASQENLGFSKGNNLAISRCKGEFILLLNPDTVVEENTFIECIEHMHSHPECGALGVRMLDGKGHFLPESKRGLPTPATAFYKISGLYKIFPKSAQFNRYYLGHQNVNENQEVEILAGAFMFIRKKVLDQIGWLDEDYFMYGEDIDLSYRIVKAGYQNHYLANTRIIHYKGESTKKGSLNYVFVFYQAMAIFARKHFKKNGARTYFIIIQLAIWLRASVSVLKRFLGRIHLPILDASLLWLGMYFLKNYWENNHRFISGGEYPPIYTFYVLPFYTFIFVLSIWLSGGYDRPIKLGRMQRGLFIGSLILFAAYGLLSEEWRFSRALLLLGVAWALGLSSLLRLSLQFLFKSYIAKPETEKRIWLVGSKEGSERLSELIRKSRPNAHIVGEMHPSEHENAIHRLKEACRIFEVDEVIFDAASTSTQNTLELMTALSGQSVEMKIAPPDAFFIIGSNSIHTKGEWYSMGKDQLQEPISRRNKRILDISVSLFFIVLSPLLFLFSRGRKNIKSAAKVLIGQNTWVGYQNRKTPSGGRDRFAIFHPSQLHKDLEDELEFQQKVELLYARDYKISDDLKVLWHLVLKTNN
jgi:O-antigen biosynthesis protein